MMDQSQRHAFFPLSSLAKGLALVKGPVKNIKRFALLAGVALFCLACSHTEQRATDPAGIYAEAKQPYEDENFELAITTLGEFRARYPYSKFATEAELLTANAYFELGQYIEAAAAYEQFVKLHPSHGQVDFARFRIGESYWQDSPEVPDREQAFTEKAVKAWREMLQVTPNSKYAEQAKDLISQGERRIALSLDFISAFYCKQKIYHACAYRAQQLLERFPQFKDLRLIALQRAVLSLNKLADQKAADAEDSSNLYLKAMTAQELRNRALEFQALADKTPS